jgi:regulation of enolase protein 1 (concanavalin A-like superfamily)
VRFDYKNRYDQCGLLLRLDAGNWIKLSTELETSKLSMLGSVVTNLGYSDWATTELDYVPREMWYRFSKRGADLLLQCSDNGRSWRQLRIAHIHAPSATIQGGIYACSPTDGRFNCTFTTLEIGENLWTPDS